MSEGHDTTRRVVISIDQGTSSTRCLAVDIRGHVIGSHAIEHEQIYPHRGMVEHNALELWQNTLECIRHTLNAADITRECVKAIGVASQRESTLVWDKKTGLPLHNVIVWNDGRTADICNELINRGNYGELRYQETTGLPIATYFSATKLMWLLKNVPGLRKKAEEGSALFGTIDSWIVYNLTNGSEHVTDVTNASRTMLMDLKTLQWSHEILFELDIPESMLPRIVPSSNVCALATIEELDGVPIAGILGDQQSALFGQACFDLGSTKCTYGTGCFALMNTGPDIVLSNFGLITTVAYQLGSSPPAYALEGSISYAGSTVQMCDSLSDIERIALDARDNGGVYFVPAFNGLFAPYWRCDARGTICGLTAYNNRSHIARAVLEATAFQVEKVLKAMQKDSGTKLFVLKADGGMTSNELLMHFQSSILDCRVLKPKIVETTALGVAYAAGLAIGMWKDLQHIRYLWTVGKEYSPFMTQATRGEMIAGWDKAVERSLGWVENDDNGAKTSVRKIVPFHAAKKRSEHNIREQLEQLDEMESRNHSRKHSSFSITPEQDWFTTCIQIALAATIGFVLGRRVGR